MALGLGINACSGGGDSTTPVNTLSGTEQEIDKEETATDSNLVGYLADGGIEGLFYETSSGIKGTTGEDGKYEFITGDTVTFKLGNLQIGSTVSASTEPITPMTLFNVDESNYKNNEELVNALQFFQTIDSDNYHGNGIKIDADTILNFRT